MNAIWVFDPDNKTALLLTDTGQIIGVAEHVGNGWKIEVTNHVVFVVTGSGRELEISVNSG